MHTFQRVALSPHLGAPIWTLPILRENHVVLIIKKQASAAFASLRRSIFFCVFMLQSPCVCLLVSVSLWLLCFLHPPLSVLVSLYIYLYSQSLHVSLSLYVCVCVFCQSHSHFTISYMIYIYICMAHTSFHGQI